MTRLITAMLHFNAGMLAVIIAVLLNRVGERLLLPNSEKWFFLVDAGLL